ncbi:MAG: peptidoglycan-binding protein [Armatimonadetes bacterium]|nr:peptidoglycan-binding protein [Armatimonadota bacterium]
MKRFLSLLLVCLMTGATVQAQPPQKPGYSLSKSHPLLWPVFKRGKRGEKVRVLQALLNARRFRLTVNGQFDAPTENAVRVFQKGLGLPVSGVVDAQTWEKLVVPLRRSSRGPFVQAFQMLLAANGYRVVPNGVFGASTQRAVRSFQKKEGEGVMVADGRAHDWVWCWLLGGMNTTD